VTSAKSVNFFVTPTAAALLVGSGSALARDNQAGEAGRHRAANAMRATQPHTRTTERQRTENGHTRADPWRSADGKAATRDAVGTSDRNARTRTRTVDYTTFDDREGSRSDVIQRTDDRYTRDTARTLPNGEMHTRAVDVSCDKEARKCIQQVEVGQPKEE